MNNLKTALRYVLMVFMIAMGTLHFVKPSFFLAIMPPYIPWHLAAVYLSGVFEVSLGIGLLAPPSLRPLVGWGLIALYLAVFPANLHMALNPDMFPQVPPAMLYGRLPFQLLFIGWAYWVTHDGKTANNNLPNSENNSANASFSQ
jgi:uncharacterized membrane protein